MLLENTRRSISSYYPNVKCANGDMYSSVQSSLQSGTQAASPYVKENGACVFVGTGDTEPTYGDYCLANWVSDPEVLQYAGSTAVYDIDKTIKSITTAYKNVSNSPVVIKEVAFGHNWCGYYNQNPPNRHVLLARSVLDTPVTIGVGETYAFTYAIELA